MVSAAVPLGPATAAAAPPTAASPALVAARSDAALAAAEFDSALAWLDAIGDDPPDPLSAEVWVVDPELSHVLLVRHPWRGWVPPGGKAEPGEDPRTAAERELFEETGVRAELLAQPAVVRLRSYAQEWRPTLGLSYVAIVDRSTPLRPESGQPAAWHRLDTAWEGWFADDRLEMVQHVERLRG